MTLAIFAASSLAPRVVARIGVRRVIASGMAAAAGMLLLTGLHPGSGYVGVVLAGAVLTSLGMGFSLVPATIVAMEGVPGSQSGIASGLLNTSRLMGGALGLAVLGTIADGRTHVAATAGARAHGRVRPRLRRRRADVPRRRHARGDDAALAPARRARRGGDADGVGEDEPRNVRRPRCPADGLASSQPASTRTASVVRSAAISSGVQPEAR
jgi:hypothetical protein